MEGDQVGKVEIDATGKLLKSKNSQQPVDVVFQNVTGAHVEAFWLDYEGKKTLYRNMPPGESWIVHTYVTHPWVFFDAATKERRAIAGKRAVLFPSPSTHQTYQVQLAPNLEWAPSNHHKFPRSFQDVTRVLVLQWMQSSGHQSSLPGLDSTLQRFNCGESSTQLEEAKEESEVLQQAGREWKPIQRTKFSFFRCLLFRKLRGRSNSSVHRRSSCELYPQHLLTGETGRLLGRLPFDVFLKILQQSAPPVADFHPIVSPDEGRCLP